MSTSIRILINFLLVTVSMVMVCVGLTILLWLIDAPTILIWITLGLGILTLVYFAYTFRILTVLTTWIRSNFSGKQSKAPARPIQLAQFFYILDDPIDPEQFQMFLDDPIIPLQRQSQSNTSHITPAHYIEATVFENIEALQTSSGGKITVEANIKRGSFAIDLQFFLDVYQNVSQYNDAILSVLLVQHQIKQIFRYVSRLYRGRTERNIQVNSSESLRRRRTSQESANGTHEQLEYDDHDRRPVSITNTISPPSTDRGLNVNINLNSSRGVPIGCSVIIFLAVLVSGILLYYFLSVPMETREEIWFAVREETSIMLDQFGQYLQNVSESVRP